MSLGALGWTVRAAGRVQRPFAVLGLFAFSRSAGFAVAPRLFFGRPFWLFALPGFPLTPFGFRSRPIGPFDAGAGMTLGLRPAIALAASLGTMMQFRTTLGATRRSIGVFGRVRSSITIPRWTFETPLRGPEPAVEWRAKLSAAFAEIPQSRNHLASMGLHQFASPVLQAFHFATQLEHPFAELAGGLVQCPCQLLVPVVKLFEQFRMSPPEFLLFPLEFLKLPGEFRICRAERRWSREARRVRPMRWPVLRMRRPFSFPVASMGRSVGWPICITRATLVMCAVRVHVVLPVAALRMLPLAVFGMCRRSVGAVPVPMKSVIECADADSSHGDDSDCGRAQPGPSPRSSWRIRKLISSRFVRHPSPPVLTVLTLSCSDQRTEPAGRSRSRPLPGTPCLQAPACDKVFALSRKLSACFPFHQHTTRCSPMHVATAGCSSHGGNRLNARERKRCRRNAAEDGFCSVCRQNDSVSTARGRGRFYEDDAGSRGSRRTGRTRCRGRGAEAS